MATKTPKLPQGPMRSKPAARAKQSSVAPRARIDAFGEASKGLVRKILHAQSLEFYLLLGSTLFLVAFGVVMVLSSSFVDSMRQDDNPFGIFGKQFLAAILGLAAMAMISIASTTFVRRMMTPLTLAAIVVQCIVVFTSLGVSVNGNKNWIRIFGFTLQPSEFLKLGMILLTAQFINNKRHELDDAKDTWMIVGVAGAAIMAFVAAGKDVGTVIIMAMILFGMTVLSGMPRKLTYWVMIAAAVAVPIIMKSSSSRWGRVMAWLNPSAPDPNDYGWQTIHGVWAFAAGGPLGVGLGQSQLKWSWIPEAENDFIFAIIGEEMGLIGCLIVILLIVFMALILIRIALRTDDLFKRLVVLGVMLWLSLQSFTNIAVVLTLLPVLGVPLPLISSGGSSILASLMAIGVVLAIERENHAKPVSGRRR
jgi:cell division protein FtsW